MAEQAPTPDTSDPERYLYALEEMEKTEGWKVYAAWLKGQRERLVTSLIQPGTQTDSVMRSAGALAQLELCSTWVPNQMKFFKQQVDAKRRIEEQRQLQSHISQTR